MVGARLIIEEYDEQNGGTVQEDWGVYDFASAPIAGDVVRTGHDEQSRDVKVLKIVHLPATHGSGSEPTLYVICEY